MKTEKIFLTVLVAVPLLCPGNLFASETPSSAAELARVHDLLNEYRDINQFRDNWSSVKKAKIILDKILEEDPSYAPAYHALARYHLMHTDHVKKKKNKHALFLRAEKELRRALKLDPEFVNAYVYLGNVYNQMGRRADAKDALRKAEQMGTKSPWLDVYWGLLLSQEGNEDAAIVRFKKVLNSGTNSKRAIETARFGLVREPIRRAENLLNSYTGNIAVLEAMKAELVSVLEIQPSNKFAYKLLAQYFIKRGFIKNEEYFPAYLEAAEHSLKKALEIDPDYSIPLIHLGRVYRLMGRLAEARVALATAKEHGNKTPFLEIQWAELLWREGNAKEAAAHYQKIVQDRERYGGVIITALQGLIRYNQSIGNLSEIDNLHRQILTIRPTAWAYGNYATFLLCQIDRYDDAIRYGRTAVSLMNYGLGRYYLAAALYRKWSTFVLNGDKITGRKYLDEGRSYYPNIGAIADDTSCPPLRFVRKALRSERARLNDTPAPDGRRKTY